MDFYKVQFYQNSCMKDHYTIFPRIQFKSQPKMQSKNKSWENGYCLLVQIMHSLGSFMIKLDLKFNQQVIFGLI